MMHPSSGKVWTRESIQTMQTTETGDPTNVSVASSSSSSIIITQSLLHDRCSSKPSTLLTHVILLEIYEVDTTNIPILNEENKTQRN